MYQKLNRVVEAALEKDEVAVVQLLEMVEPLIKSMIRKYFPYTTEYADLYSEAQLLLLECLEEYDRKYGVYFIGFFRSQLRFYLLDRIKENVRSDLPILDQQDENGETMMNSLTTDEDIEALLLEKEAHGHLHHCLDKLSKREFEIIRLFYYYDLGISEICGYLDLSYQTVANTKSRALRKLRDYYLEFESKEKRYVH